MSRRDAEFTDFVEGRRQQLRGFAYGLCGDWHRADDLVQTALVKLYLAWPRVRRDGREEAYVRRILVNAHIDEGRRPWRREVASPELPERAATSGPSYADRSALVAALQELPPMQRSVVLLRHWLGLSVAETAAELGIGEGTVKSHTHRALAALEASLSRIS